MKVLSGMFLFDSMVGIWGEYYCLGLNYSNKASLTTA